jgi:hypothetical protein
VDRFPSWLSSVLTRVAFASTEMDSVAGPISIVTSKRIASATLTV